MSAVLVCAHVQLTGLLYVAISSFGGVRGGFAPPWGVRGGFAPPCRKSKRPMYQGPPGRVSASKYARPYRRVTATVSSFCRLVVFYCWGFTV